MIRNINLGICQNRLQQGQPSFFINWNENGTNNYRFSCLRFVIENFKNELMAKKERDYGMTVELCFQGFDIEVHGYYEEGEEAVNYPVDSAYPGSPDKFDIDWIKLDGKIITTLPENVKIDYSDLEQRILDKII